MRVVFISNISLAQKRKNVKYKIKRDIDISLKLDNNTATDLIEKFIRHHSFPGGIYA